MEHRQRLAARALAVRALEENIPSPCVSVCRMDERTGYCLGCWRKLDEIARWAVADTAEKQAIWATIAARLDDTNRPHP
ncbi:MAG: DUF1289 domain-containing protein [Rhodoferax sp.]